MYAALLYKTLACPLTYSKTIKYLHNLPLQKIPESLMENLLTRKFPKEDFPFVLRSTYEKPCHMIYGDIMARLLHTWLRKHQCVIADGYVSALLTHTKYRDIDI